MCDIEDGGTTRSIFWHEYAYVMYYGFPIKKGCLIAHKDNNLDNNEADNLIEIPSDNDFHKSKNMVFHSNFIDKRKKFIKKNFNDVYKRLDLDKPLEERGYYKDGLLSKEKMKETMEKV